ncbi:hypothetical protein [Peptostreptococcus sp. D1]|uniref:hypothetical protein n=1 Tax=Peptostreptococcus sp. D1 TaxID=72304 RepID=UPI0008E872CA|nr:hypothetical protein [Peptostreptococcus sp. D1]SFE17631.1 hypothetical protein SAMN02910278_00136 [Peptostreptococcus sp. D1]
MVIDDILNRDYRLCNFSDREKSVLYREVDLDNLILENLKLNEISTKDTKSHENYSVGFDLTEEKEVKKDE